MLEDGEEIPSPSNLDSLADGPAMKDAVAFLLDVVIADKVERFNITARKSQMEEIDRIAKKPGITRPAYIVAAALGRLTGASESTR